jgi:beta-barrel assembly-enhancing protease
MRLRLVGICCSFALLLSPLLALCQPQSAPEGDAGPAPVSQATIHHGRSIQDINAIGIRNVGCGRGLGNWYSLPTQIAMGKDYANRVEATSKLITDPEITEYINRVGQNLVRNSDAQVPFTIKVIDSDDVNAVALPGGFFYIDSGLILAAENEAELAGVMAHEIAHVAACHAARGRTRVHWMSLASLSMTVIGGPIAYAAYETMNIAKPLTFLRFSRKFESEADFLGVQYMYRAGYDPQALATFFERVKAMEKGKVSAVAKAFATHPQTVDRIEKTQDEINSLLPPETMYRVDTSDFQDVKARLYQRQNGLRIESGNHPRLRRTPTSD